jgi:predicted lipoprotein with Yx(FWY)xxD motif
MRPLAVLAALVATLVVAGDALAADRGTLQVRGSDYGPVLFDGRGYALYAFTYDRKNRSRCYGACAEAWPPYLVKKPKAGAGAKRSLLGTTRRSDGSIQATYNGWPLYYYVHDPKGEILCQNVREFGGLWLILRGSGKLVR